MLKSPSQIVKVFFSVIPERTQSIPNTFYHLTGLQLEDPKIGPIQVDLLLGKCIYDEIVQPRIIIKASKI